MHASGRVKPKATINNESWPTFHGSSTLQNFVEFLRLGPFLRDCKGKSHETWVMDTSWRVKLKPANNTESWPTSHGSMASQIFVELLRLGHFLRNYRGWSHETLVMHTSGRVKLKATINNESWPTFHGSLTSQIFVQLLRLDQFLRNYKG